MQHAYLTVGVVAWAVSAEVVMGARRETAFKSSDPSLRFHQGFHAHPSNNDFNIDRVDFNGEAKTILETNSRGKSTLTKESRTDESRLKVKANGVAASKAKGDDAESSNVYLLSGLSVKNDDTSEQESDKNRKSPGAQVAEVIDRLVAERKHAGVSPHIVVVAPIPDIRKKNKTKSSSTTTTTSTSPSPSTVTTKRTTTPIPPPRSLSRDPDALLAAAHLLAQHSIATKINEETRRFVGQGSPTRQKQFDQEESLLGSYMQASEPSYMAVALPVQHRSSEDHYTNHGDRFYNDGFSSHRIGVVPPPQLTSNDQSNHQRPIIGPMPPPKLNRSEPSRTQQINSNFPSRQLSPPQPQPPFQQIQQVQQSQQPQHTVGNFAISRNSMPVGPPIAQRGLNLPPFLQNGQVNGQMFAAGSSPEFLSYGPSFGRFPAHHGALQSQLQPAPPHPPPLQTNNNHDHQGAESLSDGKAVVDFHAAERGEDYEEGYHDPTPQKGLTLHFGGGPIGGGGQIMTSPIGIFKTLLLPLLPKPRVNLNGKVVFGVVLEKGVGFGKQKTAHYGAHFPRRRKPFGK